jgi:[protein-PII] uridylyltransferase
MSRAERASVSPGIARPPLVFDEAAAGRSLEAAFAGKAGTEASRRSEFAKNLRLLLDAGRREIERRLMAGGKGRECAATLCYLQDQIIRQLHRFAARQSGEAGDVAAMRQMAIIAVGGYGRGTLAPGSDLDLLFLLPDGPTAPHERITETVLYALWDMRLKVGHATRSIDDNIRLARADDTVKTALLEARHVSGDAALHEALRRRFRKEVVKGTAREFIAAKLSERDARHAKTGQSRYLVEPDVKDGMGGLRDVQTLVWIARYLFDDFAPADLVAHGIFNAEEMARFTKCEDFLWAVRCHMHFMTGRPVDRLSFELQADLAERLGYSARGGLKHVERFMKHYFILAKEVGDLSRIFCAVLESRAVKKAPGMADFWRGLTRRRTAAAIAPDGWFRIDAGRVNVIDETCFTSHPIAVLKLFAVADERRIAIHPDALKSVRRCLPRVSAQLRDDPASNELFLRLLCDSSDPETTLRRLNEAGVLARFLPAFGNIVALMQFNMYHHYTVDEHLIRAVGVLSAIERGSLKEDHPVASDIVHTIVGRRGLYVAALLHDIAKGRAEHHSIAGERIARELAPRLGLSAAETDTAAWLVRHHLLMSETAQMRDLNDFKTILDFAAIVQSPERLKLLLILTVVDIRAVGPGVWNGWKGQLLRTLYWETEPVVSGGHTAVSRGDRVREAQATFAGRLADWPPNEVEAYLARHYDAYWITVDVDRQLAQARLVRDAARQGQSIATGISTDEFTDITELTVYAPDHPRLLALITGACAAAGANISGAHIFTTTDGMALDTILIQRAFDATDDERRRAEKVAELIHKSLKGELRLRDIIARIAAPKGRITAFSVEPQVIIDNDSSNRYTVIEVAGLDRIGLLYELTEALFHLNLNIVSAHITTFGERAVDVFYVTDLTGSKITADHRRRIISRDLVKVLSGAAVPRHTS